MRAMEEELSRIDYSNIEYEYDTEGRLSGKTCYEARWRDWKEKYGELSYWVEYSYAVNEADGTIDRMEREYDRDGILCDESLFDSQGKLLKERIYRDNALSYEYEYDRLENQSWGISYDGDGSITIQYREDYDDMGNRILRAHYDGEGNLDVFEGYECDTYVVIYPYWRYENTYDNNGNLIRQTEYDHDNVESEFREYTYDEKGRLVEEFFSDEMTTESYEYEYDSAGNQVRELYIYYESDDDGSLTAQEPETLWEREYDRENRLVRYTDYDWGIPKEWYEYGYELIGVSEGNYPYDQIKIRQYF